MSPTAIAAATAVSATCAISGFSSSVIFSLDEAGFLDFWYCCGNGMNQMFFNHQWIGLDWKQS
jgi:hypothetical protein